MYLCISDRRRLVQALVLGEISLDKILVTENCELSQMIRNAIYKRIEKMRRKMCNVRV